MDSGIEHTLRVSSVDQDVFGELLGLAQEEIGQLEEEGIIDTKPPVQQQGGFL